MNPEAETQIPLLPIHSNKVLEEASQTMGRNVPHRSSFKLTDVTVNIPSSKRRPLVSEGTTSEENLAPSRWSTIEFKIYYAVALIIIPVMVWIPVSLSSSSHPNFPFYRSKLSDGWIMGRFVDNSDAQYRTFRNNIPILSIAILFHLFFKYIASVMPAGTQSVAPPKLQNLSPSSLRFNLAFSLVTIMLLHGVNSLKIMLILFLNYSVAKNFRGSKLGTVLTWAWPVVRELSLAGLVCGDLFSLRNRRRGCRGNQRINGETATIDLTSRLGPIITFNDFMWQHRYPNKQPPTSTRIKSYIFRFIFSLLTMECILHFMYVVAIKDRKAWVGFTPAQISMVGFWNLIIIWLKLLIPWRFFRLWALLDGVDPPENMVRCMANNYSTMGFWRSWHRSYNLWIIRYIYVPLGGSKNLVINTVIVFSFVALWHDLTFRLLAWGWLISLFIIPELLARWLIPSVKYGHKVWFRHIGALGAVANILMMMGANLVGFVIGAEGMKFFVREVFGTVQGLKFLLAAVAILFVGVQLMFEYREEEHRQGIYRRC
ncbi:hypothetical protein Agabi119p4_5622 [Agaricus bisporus var. burnettii]|uniref:Glycerol transporter n=1 Tax=Agaricus bisporus var. burnettii TaxID=192524 RepID=A0A8H7KGC4_AGABI|nr:hypothetical protein Agabi119p4_5622 [Agaricus bisporus var. burnettii]